MRAAAPATLLTSEARVLRLQPPGPSASLSIAPGLAAWRPLQASEDSRGGWLTNGRRIAAAAPLEPKEGIQRHRTVDPLRDGVADQRGVDFDVDGNRQLLADLTPEPDASGDHPLGSRDFCTLAMKSGGSARVSRESNAIFRKEL